MKKFGNIVGIILSIILGVLFVSSIIFFAALNTFSKDKLNGIIKIDGNSIVYEDKNNVKYEFYEDLIRDFNRYSFTTAKTEILLESSTMKKAIAVYINNTINNIVSGKKVTSEEFKTYFISSMDDVFKTIDLSDSDKTTVINIFKNHGDKLFEKNVYKYIEGYEYIGFLYGVTPKIFMISSIALLGFLILICFETIKKGGKALGAVFTVSGLIILLLSIGIENIDTSNLVINTAILTGSFENIVKDLFRSMMPYGTGLLLTGLIVYAIFYFTNLNERLFCSHATKEKETLSKSKKIKKN